MKDDAHEAARYTAAQNATDAAYAGACDDVRKGLEAEAFPQTARQMVDAAHDRIMAMTRAQVTKEVAQRMAIRELAMTRAQIVLMLAVGLPVGIMRMVEKAGVSYVVSSVSGRAMGEASTACGALLVALESATDQLRKVPASAVTVPECVEAMNDLRAAETP